MSYFFLGHGSLSVDPTVTPPEMEYVAIPHGTTIQFYVDTGQLIYITEDDLSSWDTRRVPWPALDSSRVTYNLALHHHAGWAHRPETKIEHLDLIRPNRGDGPLLMCTGTPETCPTDPRQIAQGAKHDCEGILAKYQGELHWAACLELEGAARETKKMVLDGKLKNVNPSRFHPDLTLHEQDIQAIRQLNAQNLANAADFQPLKFLFQNRHLEDYRPESLFLIGDGHDYEHEQYLTYSSAQPAMTDHTCVKIGDEIHLMDLEVWYGQGVADGIREAVRNSTGREVRLSRRVVLDAQVESDLVGFSPETDAWYDGETGQAVTSQVAHRQLDESDLVAIAFRNNENVNAAVLDQPLECSFFYRYDDDGEDLEPLLLIGTDHDEFYHRHIASFYGEDFDNLTGVTFVKAATGFKIFGLPQGCEEVAEMAVARFSTETVQVSEDSYS